MRRLLRSLNSQYCAGCREQPFTSRRKDMATRKITKQSELAQAGEHLRTAAKEVRSALSHKVEALGDAMSASLSRARGKVVKQSDAAKLKIGKLVKMAEAQVKKAQAQLKKASASAQKSVASAEKRLEATRRSTGKKLSALQTSAERKSMALKKAVEREAAALKKAVKAPAAKKVAPKKAAPVKAAAKAPVKKAVRPAAKKATK